MIIQPQLFWFEAKGNKSQVNALKLVSAMGTFPDVFLNSLPVKPINRRINKKNFKMKHLKLQNNAYQIFDIKYTWQIYHNNDFFYDVLYIWLFSIKHIWKLILEPPNSLSYNIKLYYLKFKLNFAGKTE